MGRRSGMDFVDVVDELIGKGKYDQATELIIDNLPDDRDTIPGRVTARLERLAPNSPLAAYYYGNALISRGRAGDREKAYETYQRLIDCGDEPIEAAANFAVGALLASFENDFEKAIPYLARAAGLGNSEARVMYASVLLDGSGGVEVDQAEAVRQLQAAADADNADAMIALADLVLSGSVKPGDIDPMVLISRAMTLGHPDALAMFIALQAASGDPADIDTLETLPYVVKPDGMKRAKQVRDAMVQEFGMRASDAEDVTAALYGCPGWNRLTQIVADSRIKPGVFDEDLAVPEQEERSRALAAVLLHYVDMPSYVADIAIALLQPTARDADKPSLKKLRENAEGRVFKMGMNAGPTLGQTIFDEHNIKSMGMDAVRFAYPIVPWVWLNIMQDHLGWSIIDADEDATEEGALVGRTFARDGRSFSIYMSRVSFNPGDRGDVYVEDLMKKIAAKTPDAVLLFNRALVHFPEKKSARGVLFGGKVCVSGRWSEFVLRPGGGIDDAITQDIVFGEKVPDGFADRFAFDDAGHMGAAISAQAMDVDENTRMLPLINFRDWTSFMPADFAEMMKQMPGFPGAR